MQSAPRSPWKKILWIGCGIGFALFAVIAIVVALNWGAISSFVSETADTLSALSDVQDKLREKFHTPLVSAQSKTTTGVQGRILSIEVVNAPFFDEMMLDEDEGKVMAFDIACSAHAALPEGMRYEHYEVIFNQRTQVGLTFSHRSAHRFEESDLGPEPFLYRSGTLANDRNAAPLGADVQKFEPALMTANRCIDSLRVGDYAAVYAICGDEIRSTMDEPKVAYAWRQAVEKFGAIRSYEPMQWKFAVRGASTRRLLVCTKIVEHERGVINYSFTFDEGGAYQTLVGFVWAPRPDSPATEAHK